VLCRAALLRELEVAVLSQEALSAFAGGASPDEAAAAAEEEQRELDERLRAWASGCPASSIEAGRSKAARQRRGDGSAAVGAVRRAARGRAGGGASRAVRRAAGGAPRQAKPLPEGDSAALPACIFAPASSAGPSSACPGCKPRRASCSAVTHPALNSPLLLLVA
jgi:hypothetical protein